MGQHVHLCRSRLMPHDASADGEISDGQTEDRQINRPTGEGDCEGIDGAESSVPQTDIRTNS